MLKFLIAALITVNYNYSGYFYRIDSDIAKNYRYEQLKICNIIQHTLSNNERYLTVYAMDENGIKYIIDDDLSVTDLFPYTGNYPSIW